MLVVARVRAAAAAAGNTVLELPAETAGRWYDVLGDDEITLAGSTTVEELGAGFRGLWLLERR